MYMSAYLLGATGSLTGEVIFSNRGTVACNERWHTIADGVYFVPDGAVTSQSGASLARG